MKKKHQTLLIIDFGSQVTKLIARRLREKKVYCDLLFGVTFEYSCRSE